MGSSWPSWAITWYAVMCFLGVFNMIVYLVLCQGLKRSSDALTAKYQRVQCLLAGPFIFVCTWRCFFPNLYEDRITWYDSWLCSIGMTRMAASVAELCWIAQVAIAIAFMHKELTIVYHGNTSTFWTCYTHFATYGFVLVIFCAECCSDYATVTKDNLGFALEETCWGIAFTILLPAAFRLVFAFRTLPAASVRQGGCCSAWVCVVVISCLSTAYLIWQWTMHVPPLWGLWFKQIRDGVQPLSFIEGMKDALFTYNTTHDYEIWSGSLVWLTGYMSGSVWSSLLLVGAPRIGSPARPMSEFALALQQSA